MYLHANFAGGNITLQKIEGDDVYIEQQLRDTDDWWFYWGFCVEGAQGRRLTFHFTNGDVLGYWGPALSHDNVNYRWAGSETVINEHEFAYSFSADESRVFFRYALPYQYANFENWLRARGANVYADVLCVTERGRNLPYIVIGDKDARGCVYFTCRHHACESMAQWALEGALDEMITRLDELNARGLNVIAVPFIDLDGVEDGDQGKSRAPHDHNRDYIDAPIYSVTRALAKLVKRHTPVAFIDYHDPWYRGGVDDHICLIRGVRGAHDAPDQFAEYLKEETARGAEKDDIVYDGSHDLYRGEAWVPAQPNPAKSVSFFKRNNANMAISIEVPYFGCDVLMYTQTNTRRLGACIARALMRTIS